MLRVIKPVGTAEFIRIFWDGCNNCMGHDSNGFHNATASLGSTNEIPFLDREMSYFPTLVHEQVKRNEYNGLIWPTRCDHCHEPVPENKKSVEHQFYREPLYNTESGKPEPNDCFYRECATKYCSWTNCTGFHLIVVLPIKYYLDWDTSERSQNCTNKLNRTHRCWVIEGEIPKITSGKNGETCGAGSGSIWIGELFHKKLLNGEWV